MLTASGQSLTGPRWHSTTSPVRGGLWGVEDAAPYSTVLHRTSAVAGAVEHTVGLGAVLFGHTFLPRVARTGYTQ